MGNIIGKNQRKNSGVLESIFLFILVVLFFVPTLIAQEGIKGNLVDVNWLENNLNNSDVILLDASPSQVYTANHIPGAINYDIFIYGINDMPAAEIEKRYQSWGISPGKKIVMYDQGGSMLATRMFFSFYYYGVSAKDLFILDGGLSKWQEAGFAVTSESTPLPNNGSFKIGKLNESAKAELPEFLTASGDLDNNVLIEALQPDWHFGAPKFFNKPGHIPNAISLPSTDFYNSDNTFKSPEEIKKMLDYLKVKPEQNIYTHCGGGIAASVPYFALKFIVGYPDVKLFQGSQLEWISDERELPIWTYDEPYLMRDTKWLQFWGGKVARMYGISHVTILDVRSADEFSKGHLPVSINIPADVFKNNITDPGKLAAILGDAGVNANDEAVIISGEGLTKESALVFAVLEMLGQKKISIYTDSIDKWVLSGNSLVKDTTVAGTKNISQVTPISSTTYPANLLEGVIITDPGSTHGLYPKVFIASGNDVPSKHQEDTVVHLSYTDLLNEDGTPKEAKDIWNILDKAGVPRYAELVCNAVDPGEAAVNYFILKLMGFPDIKLLVN
jgi:thiosulfate/3-mercaptopyruvate sulfurtransferase